MTVIKPGRESVSATSSIITISGIPVGEEISTAEAHIISRWLQRNIVELIRAIDQIEDNEE